MNNNISVIMSVYKENELYLTESIKSILNQTYPYFEFIIVLDDPNNKIAYDVLNKYKKIDNRIKILYNEKNIGISSSLNKAIKETKFDYIAKMDADDICELNRFEIELDYLNKNDLNFVGSNFRVINENNTKIIRNFKMKSFDSDYIRDILLRRMDCLQHPTWILKKDIYTELNGYREMLACEDYDFILRALFNNIKIGMCPEILLNYRMNPSSISHRKYTRQAFTSMYLRKYFYRINDINQKEIDDYYLFNYFKID